MACVALGCPLNERCCLSASGARKAPRPLPGGIGRAEQIGQSELKMNSLRFEFPVRTEPVLLNCQGFANQKKLRACAPQHHAVAPCGIDAVAPAAAGQPGARPSSVPAAGAVRPRRRGQGQGVQPTQHLREPHHGRGWVAGLHRGVGGRDRRATLNCPPFRAHAGSFGQVFEVGRPGVCSARASGA
jgi:hypothetical protein